MGSFRGILLGGEGRWHLSRGKKEVREQAMQTTKEKTF